MKKTILLIMALLPLLVACVKRDWTNPFSSDCPKEIWTPTNFAAVQEGNTVKLTWNQPINNISGFKIQKSVDGVAGGTMQDPTKGTLQLTDNSPTGGKMHQYSLTAFAGSNTSHTVTAQITPVLTAGITTTAVSAVGAATAQSGGTISSDGGAAISARGVCWATTQNPTIAGSKTTDGTGTGNFASSMTGLSPGTTYYVRAYAVNSVGTAYGNELSFTTSVTLPAITTAALSAITATTAISGGSISTGGGATITARGVCWGIASGPTILGSKTTDGTGTGAFSSSMSGLIPGTTYYIRAYATNSAGTAYGNEITFSSTATIPTLTTTVISSIAATSASSGGNVTTDGGATVIARGVCWGTAQAPTIAGSKTTDGTGSGGFTSSISGLAPGTTYYVRAYAINSVGTAYGNELPLTTSITLPAITTTALSAIASTTATSGGNITADGGAAITARGVCWRTTANPTIGNSKTTDGTGTGIFTSTITGLSPGTTYYVKAYATNSAGTVYGNEVIFSALALLPTLTTTAISSIAATSATSGGSITADGGAAITARGICWSTSSNPTITNSKTTDGTGKGIFTSASTGLTAATTYYVRAYATNSAGTAYGNELSFLTQVAGIVFNLNKTYGTAADIEGNVYKTIQIGTQLWMAENLKTSKYKDGSAIPMVTDGTVWDKLTTPGYCLYNNDETTNKDIYGALYNWYTVGTGKLCPTGWHVPSDAEWTILTTYLGGESAAGGKMKESGLNHWSNPNTGASNESGLTAVPGGGRGSNGTYVNVGDFGSIWSSTETTATSAYYRSLHYASTNVTRNSSGNKQGGFSVRCISGELTLPVLTTEPISGIALTAAVSGGNISNDGGTPVLSRGVCWSTSSSPTIANSLTVNGSGSGAFTSSIIGLATGTNYYVRAYATNNVGIAYGNEVTFKTNSNSGANDIIFNPNLTYGSVTDVDGNTYKTIQIGTQTWMAENLKTTKYNDNTAIPLVTDVTPWANLTTPGFCWFNNDEATNKNTYGALYNWYTVNTGKLCPTGWRVPSDSEWNMLTTFLGGETVAGGKLKETGTSHWASPNTGATNTTGFSAVPGDARDPFGTFYNIGYTCLWWSSSEDNATLAWIRYMSYNFSGVDRINYSKKDGHSVRCLKIDLSLPIITTNSITTITSSTASSGGNFSNGGGTAITAKGICWSTSSNPTITNSKTNDGTGTGSFTSVLTGLAAGTTYYVRAYASNSAVTVYGDVLSFKTSAIVPTLATSGISAVTATSASCGGTVSSDGGATVSSRGVCWSTTSNPTITNSKTTDGTGTGSFVSTLTGLAAGTTYYVRAYAINSLGTGYGAQVSFTTAATNATTVTDIEGNVYKTVTIGTQVWMAENLKTIKYNDGTVIPMVTDNAAWSKLSTPAYCWYNNDPATYKSTYGALYNWFTVNTGKLCPTGWHVPTDTEWTMLTTFLGGEAVAGGQLKETGTSHWFSPNAGATNTTGFTALPGTNRHDDGMFGGLGNNGSWWTSSVSSPTERWARIVISDGSYVGSFTPMAQYGNSVRCISGVLPLLPTITTTTISGFTSNSASSGGIISNDGGSIVSARGVCWNTTSNPTTSNNKTNDGTGAGVFTSSITGLAAGTTYYVRAFASNSAGTVYGNEVSFKTLATLPTLSTSAISSITATSATGGGTISSNGGGIVTAKGVCWATTSNPTINNSKTTDGTGTGGFVSTLSGLSAGTTYYARAYATNSAGTAYGNEVSFKSLSGANDIIFNPNLTYGSVNDIDGNTYKTIQIGTQTWMAENLKTTKFNDGTPIPLVTDNTAWNYLDTPGYCWYNNDAATNKNTYGALYHFRTVDTGKLCPTGWRVPSDAEWTTLTTYLGGESVAGNKLKETGTSHWLSPNTGATNETGFTALPGGYREAKGLFNDIGIYGYWWSSTWTNVSGVWNRSMFYYHSDVSRSPNGHTSGLSVRCLRDF